jgi:hypothetical protein
LYNVYQQQNMLPQQDAAALFNTDTLLSGQVF